MHKGIYILQIKLKKDLKIEFGKHNAAVFPAGFYYYVGSALKGLDSRIQRHLSNTKRMHWHIDYLLKFGFITNIYIKETIKREECFIAQKLTEKLESIDQFGSSDCECSSHLFFSKDQVTQQFFDEIQLKPYINHTKN